MKYLVNGINSIFIIISECTMIIYIDTLLPGNQRGHIAISTVFLTLHCVIFIALLVWTIKETYKNKRTSL